MKKSYALLLWMVLAAVMFTGHRTVHEFYVSLTEIRFNPVSERMEVSLRIFPDDMDRAMQEHFGIQSNLVTELEHEAADSLLEAYLDAQLKIELDGKKIHLNYLGKEAEADVMWCYLESDQAARPGEISVTNPILTEVFEDQVNIVQVYVDKWNRGLLLNREKTQGLLVIGE